MLTRRSLMAVARAAALSLASSALVATDLSLHFSKALRTAISYGSIFGIGLTGVQLTPCRLTTWDDGLGKKVVLFLDDGNQVSIVGLHWDHIKVMAHCLDSYAKSQVFQRRRHESDSRGDNESWRDASALRLLHVRSTLARQHRAPRSEVKKPSRGRRRRLGVQDHDSDPTTVQLDLSGPVRVS